MDVKGTLLAVKRNSARTSHLTKIGLPFQPEFPCVRILLQPLGKKDSFYRNRNGVTFGKQTLWHLLSV